MNSPNSRSVSRRFRQNWIPASLPVRMMSSSVLRHAQFRDQNVAERVLEQAVRQDGGGESEVRPAGPARLPRSSQLNLL